MPAPRACPRRRRCGRGGECRRSGESGRARPASSDRDRPERGRERRAPPPRHRPCRSLRLPTAAPRQAPARARRQPRSGPATSRSACRPGRRPSWAGARGLGHAVFCPSHPVMPTVTPASGPLTLVLLSGGLDSAVLAAHEAQSGTVLPVYVSTGLAWEALELAMVERLLAHQALGGRVRPLTRVEFTMRDVYPPTHWAVRGEPPAYDTPDEDVYLAGRNVVLLSKAGVVAAMHRAHRIAHRTAGREPVSGCAALVLSSDAGRPDAGPRSSRSTW